MSTIRARVLCFEINSNWKSGNGSLNKEFGIRKSKIENRKIKSTKQKGNLKSRKDIKSSKVNNLKLRLKQKYKLNLKSPKMITIPEGYPIALCLRGSRRRSKSRQKSRPSGFMAYLSSRHFQFLKLVQLTFDVSTFQAKRDLPRDGIGSVGLAGYSPNCRPGVERLVRGGKALLQKRGGKVKNRFENSKRLQCRNLWRD